MMYVFIYDVRVYLHSEWGTEIPSQVVSSRRMWKNILMPGVNGDT